MAYISLLVVFGAVIIYTTTRIVMYKNCKAFLTAVQTGDTGIAKALLACHPYVLHARQSQTHGTWTTPIHIAVYAGNIELLRFLLDNGGNVDIEDHMKCTPLHEAAKYGRTECALLLLQRGADINRKGYYDQTPIYYRIGDAEFVRFAIEHGASVIARDSHNGTPLHGAVKLRRLDVVRVLIEHGADIHAKDSAGISPLEIAKRERFDEILQFLQANGAN